MFRGTRNVLSRAALVLAATAALGACDSTTEPDDHQEAVGLVITDESNNTLVSINAARQVTGALTIQVGQARHLELYFVDEDGDRFQVAEGDAEYTLSVEVTNEAIAMIDSHGDHMDLEGVAVGATTVEFGILHGGHFDYRAPLIPITVTP